MNEILPDPSTSENQDEWVELFNNGIEAVDVNGYVLKDSDDTHDMVIDLSKTDGSTIINPGLWLVVYRRGDSNFSLNNTGSENVRLFTSLDLLIPIDTFSYDGSSEDMTWGRIPDGGSIFYSERLQKSPGNANISPPSPSPTPTNSPTTAPTQVPTVSPTVKPTPTKSSSPKPTVSPTPTPTDEPIEESIQIVASSPSPTGIVAGATTTKKSPILAIILITLGIGFLGYGGYLLYNQMHAENQKTP